MPNSANFFNRVSRGRDRERERGEGAGFEEWSIRVSRLGESRIVENVWASRGSRLVGVGETE